MKTLIVHYLPTGFRSNTKKLLDAFLMELGERPYNSVDLITASIPFFDQNSMGAYLKKHYNGNELNGAESNFLSPFYQLQRDFVAADVVVMVYPMHNFGMPGRVKSYLDAVIFNGETFEMGKKKMSGRKALTLFTSGGTYPTEKVTLEYPHWDTLTLSAQINFGFMGFDVAEVIGTSFRDAQQAPKRLDEATQQIKDIVRRWYG